MSDSPPPSGTPTWPCTACEQPVNDEILADTPDCPHGWVSFEGMSMADIKAVFADAEDCDCDEPHLSLDPVAAPLPETPQKERDE